MQTRTVPKWWLDNLKAKFPEVLRQFGKGCATYIEDEWVILIPKEEK